MFDFPLQKASTKKIYFFLFFLEFPENALRKDLWLLAKAKAAEEPRYKVDDIIKEAGHEVLRLPPYHCDLNPIGIFHKYILVVVQVF